MRLADSSILLSSYMTFVDTLLAPGSSVQSWRSSSETQGARRTTAIVALEHHKEPFQCSGKVEEIQNRVDCGIMGDIMKRCAD